MDRKETKPMRTLKRKYAPGLLAAALVLLSFGFLFSQSAPSEKDLWVTPPGYAKFDTAMTKGIQDYLELPVNKAAFEGMASSLGFQVELKMYVFVCDRTVEEVAQYYAGKLGSDYEIEPQSLFDPPSELEEAESESGFQIPQEFLDKYRAAYDRYKDIQQQATSFDTGDFDYQTGGTSVSIEIENPGVDINTMQPVNRTVITYMTTKFSK